MNAVPLVGRCIEKTRDGKTNFLSIMYQAFVPWTVSYNIGSLGLTCTCNLFKLGLFCILTIILLIHFSYPTKECLIYDNMSSYTSDSFCYVI